MKAILLPFRSQHAYNILLGKKTLELRTRIPKEIIEQIKNKEIDGVWVYGYVTKGYPLLNYIDDKYKLMDRKNHTIFHNIGMYEFYSDNIHLNGTIPFRFWFDEYEELEYTIFMGFGGYNDDLNDLLCLTDEEIDDYGKGKNLYAWHIKKLHIFDKPKALSEFYRGTFYETPFKLSTLNKGEYINKEKWLDMATLKRPPQSYQYVWVKE